MSLDAVIEPKSLDAVFKPRTVAIVGASARKEKAGYKFAKAVLDARYTGDFYFTNPTGGEVFGHKIHRSVAEIGREIDLALVQVSRERIREVMEDCAAAGVKAVILYTSGFSEADELGMRLQAELLDFINSTGLRVIGPNCQGVFSAEVGLDLTGSGDIPSGNIGMISQSGGLGSHAWHEAATNLEIGFSSFVSIGNQVDIAVHEYLEYMGDDPNTHAIVLYLEGLKAGTGREFLETARAVSRRKPVVALKGGQTESGQRAANSHTASLVGTAAVFSAALREAGVIEVEAFEELLPVAQALLLCEPLRTDRLALVGFGGGHSTLAADAVERAGFQVPAFSAATDARMRALLPYWAPRKNPVDLAGGYLGNLRVWVDVVRAALEEEGIGGVLLYGPWASYMPELRTGEDDWESVTREVAALQREYSKPIVACSHTGRGSLYQNDVLRAGGVPMFESIRTGALVLEAMHQRHGWLEKSGGSHLRGAAGGTTQRAPAAGELDWARNVGNLTEQEAYDLLARHGIPVAPYRMAGSAAEASAAAAEIGYPVVMKVCSRKIVHKSDVQGVVTGLASDSQTQEAYRALIDRLRQQGLGEAADNMLIAKQLSGLELIVGYVKDAHFGPTVMVGMGGIFVEILKDVSVRLAPVTLAQAKEMLAGLKAAPLLFGARGQPALDTEAVVDIIVRLSELGASLDEVGEIDLNPVIVSRSAAQAADARVILNRTAISGDA